MFAWFCAWVLVGLDCESSELDCAMALGCDSSGLDSVNALESALDSVHILESVLCKSRLCVCESVEVDSVPPRFCVLSFFKIPLDSVNVAESMWLDSVNTLDSMPFRFCIFSFLRISSLRIFPNFSISLVLCERG